MATVTWRSLRRASQGWSRLHQHSAAACNPRLRQMSTSEPVIQKRLDGKVAIITGGAGGIGSTTAKLFVSHGAHVILADIQEEKGRNVASEIGSNAHFKYCDVAKEQDVAAAVDFATEKFGKLDIMFNNAGFVASVEHFETLDMDAYDKCTSVMVRGVVVGIKHAARVMVPAKTGVILTTASVAAGIVSGSFPIPYCINKSNLPGLTKIAAYFLGKHGIRVNCVSPHAIPTPLLMQWLETLGWHYSMDEAVQAYTKASSLLGKQCTKEDIAKAALFLCSDESGYVSGQNLIVDAGWCGSKEFDPFRLQTP